MPFTFFRKRRNVSSEDHESGSSSREVAPPVSTGQADELVEKARRILLRFPDTDQEGILLAMICEGIEPQEAWQLYQFVPMAFIHVLHRKTDVQFSSEFISVNRDSGEKTTKVLRDEPIYTAAIRAAEQWLQAGATAESLLPVTRHSAEATVLAQLGEKETSVRDLVFTAPVVFEYLGRDPGELELEEKLNFVRRTVASTLSRRGRAWTIEGDLVRGPGSLAVRAVEIPGCHGAHIVLGTLLNRDRLDAPVIWDCSTGWTRRPLVEGLEQAVEAWANGTAPVVFELLTQDGSWADHFHDGETNGFEGWHVIHGPYVTWSSEKGAAEPLSQWALGHPLLPILEDSLGPYLDRTPLNGVKLLIGSAASEEFAEVRVNGQYAGLPSAQLRALDWPRVSEGGAYLKCFLLFVHPEPAA